MAKGTPGTKALTDAHVAFEPVAYDYDPDAPKVGLQAAESLGLDPASVLKTLMLTVDGQPVCVVLSSDHEVNLKKLAAAAGGKAAAMMKPADAERITGYKVGGVSPFGQRKRVRVFVDRPAFDHPHILVNGGQRGLLVRIEPQALVDVVGAAIVDVT
jgi:Cys-tRNA(Pro)/Cys-tRNA(Cys) deacylase